MRVEIWSDIVCPWCYIGKRRFEKGLAQFAHKDEVEVVYRSFQLDPQAPKDQTAPVLERLAAKYGMSIDEAEKASQRVADTAHGEGLPYVGGQLFGNTADAHRLVHLAEKSGKQEETLNLLYKRYFADGESVFDPKSLLVVAAQVGLDKDEVVSLLTTDEFAQAVVDEQLEAQQLGATGVPFFVIDRKYGVSGGQPAEVFLNALQQAWDEQAPVESPAGEVCGDDGCAVPPAGPPTA